MERFARAGRTKDGEIVLTAGTFHTREAKDALNRLVLMIRQEAIEHPARPPALGAKQGRLTGKAKCGAVKRQRRLRGLTGD